MYASDISRRGVVARCSKCRWSGRIDLPAIRKTLIYLDTSTLSHMAKAVARKEGSLWSTLHERLRRAVHRNVISCPSSPVIDNEAQLSEAVSRSVRELTRSFGDNRLRYPGTVQESQLLRAFRRFLDGDAPLAEYDPPFSDVSDDDPHEWLPPVQFSSMFHKRPAELDQARSNKQELSTNVTHIFARYAAEQLTFEEIRQREARGLGSALRRCGPLWPFLEIGRRRFDREERAWEAVDAFATSAHASTIPAADITSRLYAAVAVASMTPRKPRLPRGSDADDIQQIATYLPYVDVLIADRFFAQRSSESLTGLSSYRGRVRRLGEKQIPDFINYLDSLIAAAPQATLSDRLYDALSRHGSFRRFTDRLGWTAPEQA